MTEREERIHDQEIEMLTGVAMDALMQLHTLAPQCSESLTDTVGRALIRFVELCRKGAPVAKPGEEAYVADTIEAVAQRMYADLTDAGAIEPDERN